MEVFSYFMAYKNIHNMYHNMLDNNYIILKVVTRTHISSHKSYDFMNWKQKNETQEPHLLSFKQKEVECSCAKIVENETSIDPLTLN
jgi:hypothetical protein